MDEISILKQFLNFPISSTKEIFDKFKTIDGHIYREKDAACKERFLYVEGKLENKTLLIAHADTVFDTFYGTPPKSNTVLEEDGILRAVDKNGNPQLLEPMTEPALPCFGFSRIADIHCSLLTAKKTAEQAANG